ncbi:MAG TPA: ATP-binding protein [Vicinamibacteria bacterium]|nr:ATP-binding protein [Vicinamibacteria bacterium]
MGALMRAKDWSRTPLGAVEGWSPALRTMTSILLANRFPMLLWWGQDSISIYNDAYVPVLGVKHPQALGQPVRECWSEIYDVLRPLILTPLKGGPPTWSEDLPLDIRRYAFLEETHWTVAYSPIPDETAPNGIGGVLATVHEITAQVVGQRRGALLRELGVRSAAAESTEAACRSAAAIFARYPDDVPFTLMYLADPDGRTTRLAGAAGVERSRPESPETIDLTDERDDGRWLVARAARTGTAQLVEEPRPALVMPIDSSLAHQLAGVLVFGLSPRLELDDSYRGFVELATAQLSAAIANARAYQEERRRAEALASLDRAKTVFFSNVSHELRTPLTLMLGPVEDALRDPDDPLSPGQRERQQTVHRNALRLLKLVNSLLDSSRLEAGRMEASYQPTDLATFTAEIASAFRSILERAGIHLQVECAPLPEPVFVDRQLWETIVLNLLSNAFKFTFEGAITVRVDVAGGLARLVVQDTGTGIARQDLPRIFDRFHRVEDAAGRTHEGTGIGLALVRELARLHGGSVSVESEVGKGTAFTVTVPAGSAHLPQDRIRAPRALASTAVSTETYVEEAAGWVGRASAGGVADFASETGSQAAASSTRILVADDNADMRAYLARLLRPLGTVEAVVDGREALAAIRRQAPDLVLSDVMMPNLDGLALVRALREDPRTRTLPIVLLSARAGEGSRVEGTCVGADDYVVKPFSARELVARVGSQLQLARQRRDSAQRLLESETRFRALVTASSDVVYRMSPDWSEMRHLVGRDFVADTDDPSRSWLQKYIHPDDQPQVLAAVEEAIRTRSVFQMEHRILRVDGSLGWTFSRAVPLLDGNGEILEWFGAASDVTERKRAEEERARLLEEVRAAQVQLQADLDAMTTLQRVGSLFLEKGNLDSLLGEIVEAAVAVSQADFGNIQMLDRGASQLRIAAQRGFPQWWLDYWSSVSHGQGSCGTALARGERVIIEDVELSPVFVFTPALDVQRRAGVRAVQSTPLVSRSGEPLGMLSTHYRRPGRPRERALPLLDLLGRHAADLIERAHIEEALRSANEQLLEDDRRRDQFLAVLSHELRNPLAPIRNSLFVLDLAVPGGDQARRARAVIERQTEQLVRLVDDLLDVTRVRRGKIQLQRQPLELCELVRRTVDDHRSLFERKAIQLEVQPAARAVMLNADRNRLAQVVGSLLQNAAKFTAQGGRVGVAVTVEGTPRRACVRIRDDGVGMGPETLAGLFQPFVQADRTLDRSAGGLGLGLALVKGLVDLHGGEVSARSDGLGQGAEFVVRLPLETEGLAAPARSRTGTRTRSRRVLVIEDNLDAAESLRELLEFGGHEVAIAHNGPEGIAKARDCTPEVVLCDIGLPGMNGYEVARAFRSDVRLKEARLVALSGYALPEDLQRAAEAGFERHLAKPPSLEKLEETLAPEPGDPPRAG